jgi:hypothetical protein
MSLFKFFLSQAVAGSLHRGFESVASKPQTGVAVLDIVSARVLLLIPDERVNQIKRLGPTF